MNFHNTSSCDRSMVLLAPAGSCLAPFQGKIDSSRSRHAELMSKMQRLRGSVYLEDGAIKPSQLQNGLHVSHFDDQSWHLLTVRKDEVLSCIRFLRHRPTVKQENLCVSRAALARSEKYCRHFAHSLRSELQKARAANFSYIEVGGWALAEELRGSAEALRSVLATYALGQLQGGALGVATATERNGSATILRRLGGQPLEHDGIELPPYYDDAYECTMELVRFDSRCPSPRYADRVVSLRRQIAAVPVFCPGGGKVAQPMASLTSRPVFQPAMLAAQPVFATRTAA